MNNYFLLKCQDGIKRYVPISEIKKAMDAYKEDYTKNNIDYDYKVSTDLDEDKKLIEDGWEFVHEMIDTHPMGIDHKVLHIYRKQKSDLELNKKLNKEIAEEKNKIMDAILDATNGDTNGAWLLAEGKTKVIRKDGLNFEFFALDFLPKYGHFISKENLITRKARLRGDGL